MSSAEKVRTTDSLLWYLNDSLQTGWAPVQIWPGSRHRQVPLQKASQQGHLPGLHHRPAKLPPLGGPGVRGMQEGEGNGPLPRRESGKRDRGRRRQDTPRTLPRHGDLGTDDSNPFTLQTGKDQKV